MVASRLEPINLTDFTGALNLRRDQFTLSDTESPDMLNVDVDPRGGFYTRRGWKRWNADDVVDPASVVWHPANAAMHNLANDAQLVYVVNGSVLYVAPESGVFSVVSGVACSADPHGADFATWGDSIYITTGTFTPTYRRTSTGTLTTMTGATWSEVDAPVANTVPMAEFIETHAGYLFVANLTEGAALYPSRLRWSHPNRPDSFRQLDYIDIDAGGGKITAIMSFSDHLLIFKTNSLWALYGYDDDSWQLVKVSNNVGCPAITSVARSETAVYFFSASNRGGVYGYSGSQPTYMSEKIAPALESITAYENVFVSWAGRRLFVAVPWRKDTGPLPEPGTLMIFDPDIGQGAWLMYRSDHGAVATVLDGSDVNAKFPLAVFWSTETAAMVVLDVIDDAYDAVLPAAVLSTGSAYLSTTAGQLIAVTGADVNSQPFDAYYRTRWLHGGWPDRLKSWRRPMFICRKVPRRVDLMIQQFRNYDETTIRRTRVLTVPPESGPQWSVGGADDSSGAGFDWTELGAEDPAGRGADWGETREGASLIRGGPMGHAAALQVRVVAADNTPRQKWGVDGIVIKIVSRRYRT